MKVLSSAASKGAEAASAAKAAAGRAAEAVSKRTEDVMMARRERYIEVKQYLVELKDRSPFFKTSGWDKIHELWRHFFGMKKKEGGLEQVFRWGNILVKASRLLIRSDVCVQPCSFLDSTLTEGIE